MSLRVVLMLGVGGMSLMFAQDQARTPYALLETIEMKHSGKGDSLEIGKMILHFSHAPTINSLPSTTNKSKHHHIFFIPASDVSSDEVRFMMQALNRKKNDWFRISLTVEKKPVPGIKVVVECDPEKVLIEHDAFDTLGMHTGVTFTLYNKKMLDVLKTKQRSLLRLA